jgi:hypothetical protein
MAVNSTSVSGPSSSSSHIRPTGSTTFITKTTPKPIQAVHISGQNPSIARPTGGKPNVIVVQKGSTTGFSRGVTLSHGGKVSVVVQILCCRVVLRIPSWQLVKKSLPQKGFHSLNNNNKRDEESN